MSFFILFPTSTWFFFLFPFLSFVSRRTSGEPKKIVFLDYGKACLFFPLNQYLTKIILYYVMKNVRFLHPITSGPSLLSPSVFGPFDQWVCGAICPIWPPPSPFLSLPRFGKECACLAARFSRCRLETHRASTITVLVHRGAPLKKKGGESDSFFRFFFNKNRLPFPSLLFSAFFFLLFHFSSPKNSF